MQDIIKTLMDIDKQAKELLLQAKNETQNKKDSLSQEIEKVRANYDLRCEGRICKVREFHSKDVAEKISEIEAEYAKKSQELDKSYAENKDKWVDILMKKCIQ